MVHEGSREVMFRSKIRRRNLLVAMAILTVTGAVHLAAAQQQNSNQDKSLDVRSSVGDLHMGNDADARKAGLPLYPGARLRHDEDNGDSLNLGVLTDAFGIKLVVAKYDSEDPPGKVVD